MFPSICLVFSTVFVESSVMHLLASQLRLSVCSPPHLPFEVSSDGFLVFSFHISPGCHFAFVLPLKSHVTWRSDGGGEPPKWIDFFQRLPAPIISIIAPLFSVIANWLVSIFSKTLPMLYKGSHHLKKKNGILWKRAGGSTGFHISYSETHMYQKYGQISE